MRRGRCREVYGKLFAWSGDVGKLVVVFGNGSKNASQTGRGKMIGAFDGKEAWTGMQPCRRADASCRRRAIGLLGLTTLGIFLFDFLPLF